MLPLEFENETAYDQIQPGHELAITRLRDALRDGTHITVHNHTAGVAYPTRHRLSPAKSA